MQPPHAGADGNAPVEAGVIARIEERTADWCRIPAGGFRGWAPRTVLRGVGADEILD